MLENLLDTKTVPLNINLTVGEAKKCFLENNIFLLPLVNENKFVNYINYHVLELFDEKESIKTIPSFSSVLPTLNSNQHILDALKLLKTLDLPLIAVLNSEHNYIGFVKTTDIVKVLSKSFTIGSYGSILVLSVKPLDYSLSEISRIIESNDSKILGVFSFEESHSENIQVHLKINTTSLSFILATFERFGYKIIAYYNREDNTLDDNERYENLLNYLNL